MLGRCNVATILVVLFIENKYTTMYFRIIENAKSRTISGYFEKHHIIPKSIGGGDSDDNLIKLTPKEHYVCHKLLTRMLDGVYKQKMLYALYCITHVRNKGQTSRYIPSAKIYQQIKEDWRNSIKGRTAHNKGKPISEEQKEKLRLANLGKTYTRSNEYKEKMSTIKKGKSIPSLQGRTSNRKGITMSTEQKEKIRLSMLGKNTGKRSHEVRQKIKDGIQKHRK
jgi:hypothetical protein